MFLAFFASSVCVAITCSTSLVPMPCASAPNAPCVLVWLSPQTTVMPGSVAPFSGPITCTMPWRLSQEREVRGGAEGPDVGVERGDLQLADLVADAVVALGPAGGGRVVVGGGDDRADAPDLAPGQAQAFEGLRAGDLVHQVAVDVEHGRAVVLGVDDVFVPQLVVERSGGHGVGPPGVGVPAVGHSACTKRCSTAGSTSCVRTASR